MSNMSVVVMVYKPDKYYRVVVETPGGLSLRVRTLTRKEADEIVRAILAALETREATSEESA